MAEDPEGGGEKTEDASSHKLDKAREEGQVGKSIEIPSVFVVLAALLALYAFAWQMYQQLLAVFYFNLDFDHIPDATDLAVIRLLYYHFQKMFLICVPVFGAVYLVALVTNFAQVGFFVSWKALAPKFSRLDPINGFKQKFSSRSVVELVKTLLKVSIISIVCYFAIKSELVPIVLLHDTSVSGILLYIVKHGFWIGVKVCLIMIVVAFLDYAYQKWKFLEDQKMTKKEVARNIREIAREHDIPLVEDKPLARNLYNDVEVGQQVPVQYYQAVAELLAYVYGLQNREG